MKKIKKKKMTKKLNVLSLFDGIGTGYQVFKDLGYSVNYYASEINEDAILVAKKNHPDLIELGDVTKVSYSDGILYYGDGQQLEVDQIDVLIGGSPCQDLSNQKRDGKGLEGEKSSLFFDYLRLFHQTQPKYFLLENVKMKDKDKNRISEYLGVQPHNINSELLSAQKRDRLYWTNIPNVTQPKDKGIKLQDIIEGGYTERDKSLCITESVSRIVPSPNGFRRYMMGFGQLIFDSKGEYDKIVGNDKSKYSKIMRNWNKSIPLVEGVHTPKVRQLTPNEVEQLQTLPKDYTYVKELYYSSKGYNKNRGDTKRRSLMGDGWTKDVIVHIMKNMEF